VTGAPLRLLVGIKNVGRSRLLFAGPDTPGLTIHWLKYSFRSDEPGHVAGGSGGVLKGGFHNPDKLICPRAEDVLGLAPGAEFFRVAELKLPADLAPGKVAVHVEVSLAKLPDDLDCVPPNVVEADARASVVVAPSATSPGR
jgi:hypothetical protein